MHDRTLLFVALVGSVNQASTAHAIANTLDELAPDDVQVAVLSSVGDLPYYDEDLVYDSHPIGLEAMSSDIMLADGIVLVTPEYNRSLPGALKNALDWLGQLPSSPLSGKPVAIQTASHCAFGGIRIQAQILQILTALDATVLTKPEVTIPNAATKVDQLTGALRDAQARRDIAQQLAAFATFTRRCLEAISPAPPLRDRQPR